MERECLAMVQGGGNLLKDDNVDVCCSSAMLGYVERLRKHAATRTSVATAH